ncbi:hypothetical protein Tco_0634692 [Tanacetum coccineum]
MCWIPSRCLLGLCVLPSDALQGPQQNVSALVRVLVVYGLMPANTPISSVVLKTVSATKPILTLKAYSRHSSWADGYTPDLYLGPRAIHNLFRGGNVTSRASALQSVEGRSKGGYGVGNGIDKSGGVPDGGVSDRGAKIYVAIDALVCGSTIGSGSGGG